MVDEDDDEIIESDDEPGADLDGGDDDEVVLDSTFDDDDEEDEDDVTRPLRHSPAPKRAAHRNTTTVGGVPRTRLDDPRVAAEVWEKLSETHVPDDPIPYSVKEVFKLDDVITHSKFGLGFVIGVPGGTKIEVLFSDQIRKLVQGR